MRQLRDTSLGPLSKVEWTREELTLEAYHCNLGLSCSSSFKETSGAFCCSH